MPQRPPHFGEERYEVLLRALPLGEGRMRFELSGQAVKPDPNDPEAELVAELPLEGCIGLFLDFHRIKTNEWIGLERQVVEAQSAPKIILPNSPMDQQLRRPFG